MESVVLLLIGVQVIAFAVAAYILCIFPSNPTDDLVAAMHEKRRKTWDSQDWAGCGMCYNSVPAWG